MENRICLLSLCLLAVLAAVAVAEHGHEERAESELEKRAALADFKRNSWSRSGSRHRAQPSRHHHRSSEKRAALADFKRAALADFKRAALADFKRAALADFKRAALADFKRAALADFKRAALADFKRSHHHRARMHHGHGHGHGPHGKLAETEAEKRSYYWDICRKMEHGKEVLVACRKSMNGDIIE